MTFLTLRARNAWSSTLPKKNNSYFYPAAELAFIATERPFLWKKQVYKLPETARLRGSSRQRHQSTGD